MKRIVLVLSADPAYFISHGDVNKIIAADTFVVRDGKIVAQSITAKVTPKG
jgi:hypothetical protein